MRVDIHTHFHSPELFAHFDKLGGFQELVGLQVLGIHRRKHWEAKFAAGEDAVLQRRFADMDEAGCDLQVVSVGAYQPYFKAEAAARSAAEFSNDLYRDLSARHPERLAAWASLPLPHIDATLAEIDRVVGTPGIVGVALGCSAHRMPLDHEHFEPVWQELNRRGTPVYLHPGTEMAHVPGADEFHLGPDFCSPSEIAVCVARLIVRGVLQRYPNIKFIAATTGGAIPFLAHRFDHGYKQQHRDAYEELGGVLPQFKRLWCDTSVIEEPEVLKSAKAIFGIDKLLLGSDSPRIPPVLAVRYIEQSTYLTADEKTAILDRNGAAVLGLSRVAAPVR